MHGIMMLAFECTDRHEHLRTGLARRPRCCTIIQSDCKIEVDKKPVVLLLGEHDIPMGDVTMEDAGVQQRFMPWNPLASFAALKARYSPLMAPSNPFNTATREVASWIGLPASRVMTRRRMRLWVGVTGSLDRRLEQDLLSGGGAIWAELDDRLRDRLRLWACPATALPKASETDDSAPIKDFCLNVVRPHVFMNPLRTLLIVSSFFPPTCTVSWW